MKSIKLKDTWLDIADAGIQPDGNVMRLTLLTGKMTVEELEELLNPVPETLEIYESDHAMKIGEYEDYTVLDSITKYYSENQAVVTLAYPSAERLLAILLGETK